MIDFMKKLLLLLGLGTLLMILTKALWPLVSGGEKPLLPQSGSPMASANSVKGIFQPALFNINIHNER